MLEILEAGGLITVQDGGRRGWQKFGAPHAGPMDWFAFRAANLLAGNPPDAAALEIGFGDLTLRARRDCVLAAAGAGFVLSTFLWTFPLWTSFLVRAGWIVSITKNDPGNWAYLAAAGGIEAESMLGSRSTTLRAGLGKMPKAGDTLKIGRPSRALEELAARTFAPQKRPSYSPSPLIEAIEGPQADWFTKEGVDIFFGSRYRISSSSDRMGYRLEGMAIAAAREADLLSEGMCAGSVQVPPSGQPIVTMADSPTTGGYPKIACVVSADLPALAQVPFGEGQIRFKRTTVEEAQARYRAMMRDLDEGVEETENDARFAQ